ncbi:hypothetical protein ACFRAI_22405 [Streptomyces sp. NPDC056637]|uniref:hypothetical protein n=1 Tax=unclassified Streptomyces TaxID=2593676 RepID=UPI0036CDE74E
MPGFEPVAAAAATLRPDQVLGFIEALLIDWNHTFAEEPSLRIALDLPADKARRFGFITAKEQHRIMAEARAVTLENMDRFIDRVADTGASEIYLQRLKEARGNAREFHRLTLQYNKHKRPTFGVVRATWWLRSREVAAFGRQFGQQLAILSAADAHEK